MSEVECPCGRPTREGRSFCEDCADRLSRALGDVPALDAELDTTIGKRKGVDYRRVGGGKGGKTAPRGDKRISGDTSQHPTTMDTPALGAAIQSDPLNMAASEAKAHLRGILVMWVRFCEEEQVRNSSPHVGLPADTLPAMSRYLLWRVDGLALLDIGTEAVDEITSAVAHCHRLIDRPADRQYLGECLMCEGGRLYARPHSHWARCHQCDAGVDAEELRAKLLAELDDRLCTASEVAELSTYLGLPDDRERVRKRIERWGAAGKVLTRTMVNGQDHYRFGAAYLALMEHENKRERKTA